ncbi:MAG TPA: 50S ribosomal protein L3 [archaeon]|nr:50S ribosomal protein L3 [archaeon]
MGAHKPRSGSLAFYPRVRAKRHRANFTTYPAAKGEEAKALSFYGFKAGMTQVLGKNANEKSHGFGSDVSFGGTVVECPPLKIIGARVYGKINYGLGALGEATIEKPDKNLRKKVKAFKKKGKKRKEEKKYSVFEDLEALKEKAVKVVLLAEVQAGLSGTGKKKSDIAEIALSGNAEKQFAFAKEKFGKELHASEVFEANQLIDVKAVTKGKGFSGVVERFGVKVHRPKAKKHRYVGSIGPWHPPTVMWTVARAGQHGYQSRTEYNKKILFIENGPSEIVTPAGGFTNYGVVKSGFMVLAGSIPGAVKRIVTLRHAIREGRGNTKYSDLKLPGTESAGKKMKAAAEAEA